MIRKGKTYEELYGKDRAVLIKEKLRQTHIGKTSPIKGKKLQGKRSIAGKNYEDFYGKERAIKIRRKMSQARIGKSPPNKGKTLDEMFDKNKANNIREKCRVSIGKAPPQKGKSFVDFYGMEKAKEIIEKMRQTKAKTKEERMKNNRLKNIERLKKIQQLRKGKTLKEIYGKEKADKIKNKLKIAANSERMKKMSLLATKILQKIRTGKTYEELYGKEKSEALKKKLSQVHFGQISNRKGKTFKDIYGEEKSILIKEQIRKTVIKKQNGIPPKTCWKKGNKPWNTGKTYNEIYGEEETKIRMTQWRKNMDEKVIVPIKDSKPEKQMQSILQELNINFIKHKPIINIEHGYQCDIFIPEYNLIIEVDGLYWHNYPYGREIDHIRSKELIDAGYSVLRFWEGMFDKENVRKALSKQGHDVEVKQYEVL